MKTFACDYCLKEFDAKQYRRIKDAQEIEGYVIDVALCPNCLKTLQPIIDQGTEAFCSFFKGHAALIGPPREPEDLGSPPIQVSLADIAAHLRSLCEMIAGELGRQEKLRAYRAEIEEMKYGTIKKAFEEEINKISEEIKKNEQ